MELQATSKQSSINIAELKKGYLFGHYEHKVMTLSEDSTNDFSRAHLNLILVGVVITSEPDKGLAIIANRGLQATYGVNEKIEGTKAKLKAVMLDRVIIDNSGYDEILMLHGVAQKKTATVFSSKIDTNDFKKNIEFSRIHQNILKDPKNIFQYMNVSKVKHAGKVFGYRINPGKKSELFNLLGLKPNDVAIQINGQDLTESISIGKILKSVSQLSEINLKVHRNGQEHDIYIGF
ncbi:general secretion pathway protein C [Candidatus Photodesmus blepharus]|uniref:General secretion pathway protein C n=2 Tax=Candidatus Photodesmus blepharonis TaxID=1179155 RepID=A0A084CNJ5_9GAMM|nr:general secretion pathway protein C [Candidatus Photodesmus blepharus]